MHAYVWLGCVLLFYLFYFIYFFRSAHYSFVSKYEKAELLELEIDFLEVLGFSAYVSDKEWEDYFNSIIPLCFISSTIGLVDFFFDAYSDFQHNEKKKKKRSIGAIFKSFLRKKSD